MSQYFWRYLSAEERDALDKARKEDNQEENFKDDKELMRVAMLRLLDDEKAKGTDIARVVLAMVKLKEIEYKQANAKERESSLVEMMDEVLDEMGLGE